MKRKRFKHITFTICHKFSGWELINSYNEFKSTGTGVYHYNFLDLTMTFNNQEMKPFIIFSALQNYFDRELESMKIDKSFIIDALLEVNLIYEQISNQAITSNEVFYKDGNAIKSDIINEIRYNSKIFIRTDESSYESKLSSSNGWPEKWLNS